MIIHGDGRGEKPVKENRPGEHGEPGEAAWSGETGFASSGEKF
jgi:hypothetical protein